MKKFQNFHVTCKALIFYKNRFLLHRASDPEFKGALECPGGRVDDGEKIEETLKREIKEEIGLDLDAITYHPELIDINQISAQEYGLDDHTQILEIYFRVIVPDETDLILEEKEEVAKFEWVGKSTDLDQFTYKFPSRKNVYKRSQTLLF